jgi:glycosyltransferase involved in cell wall biosynthesis
MNNNNRRLRVLLIAANANPEWHSVSHVGWSHSRAIAELTDAHTVTHVENREAILRAGLAEDRFTALDPGLVERPIERLAAQLRGETGMGWTTMTALGVIPYYYFEHLVWQRFGHRIRAGEFDLVHRLTPLSPTYASVLARRCARAGVPFVLGPLNGGLPWPEGFGAVRRREREWLSYVRDGYKLMPGYHATRRHAAAIIVGSRATREQMPDRFKDKTIYIPENAIDPSRFDRWAEGPLRLPLKVAFVGRLVPYKGADMLLEAAAPLIRPGRVEIDLIGDGPERERLQGFVDREGLAGSVEFAGWIENHLLPDRLVRSHILGFPSIREFGGGVVLEAMALRLVPIVMDYGGPGELVTERTGFALPMGPRAQIVADLRGVLERLVADPSAIRAMGARARERVLRQFTWQAKATQVREVYRWVLGRRAAKPDFGMPLPDDSEERAA